MTLHDQLRAAIEARRKQAQAAALGDHGDWGVEARDSIGVIFRDEAGEHGGFLLTLFESALPDNGAGLLHVAANDPVTILRHCVRDLAVLNRHEPYWLDMGADRGGPWCSTCAPNYEDIPAEWPCDEITDLAAAYLIEVTP